MVGNPAHGARVRVHLHGDLDALEEAHAQEARQGDRRVRCCEKPGYQGRLEVEADEVWGEVIWAWVRQAHEVCESSGGRGVAVDEDEACGGGEASHGDEEVGRTVFASVLLRLQTRTGRTTLSIVAFPAFVVLPSRIS